MRNVFIWGGVGKDQARGWLEHHRTQMTRPHTSGIVERRPRTLLNERFHVEGRRSWFETIEEMQVCLDDYLKTWNERRPHQGRGMKGRTSLQAFKTGIKPPKASKEEPTTEKTTGPQPTAA